MPLIGPAHAAVAHYEGMLKGLPNANVLLSPLASQEAVLSSRIEGTQTTLTELLTFEAEGNLSDESTPARADIREVLNYRLALYAAIDILKESPCHRDSSGKHMRFCCRACGDKTKRLASIAACPTRVGLGRQAQRLKRLGTSPVQSKS